MLNLQAEQIAIERALCGHHDTGLVDFIRLAWPHVETSKYIHGRHIEQIASYLMRVSRNEINRLVINVPPGTSKSTITCVMWCAWHLACVDAAEQWMFSSYDPQLCLRDAEKTYDLITSEWYQQRWPHVQIVGRKPAMHDYSTTAGGYRFSTSVGGRGTGHHGSIQVCDDPHKASERYSAVARENVARWWSGTMATRANDASKFRRVVIGQRIADGDLSDKLVQSGYQHLCLPMRYDPAIARNDWRTVAGELLEPERFPESVVASLEAELGPDAPAQLQQDPAADGALLFSLDIISYYDTLPGFVRRVMTADLSFDDKTAAGEPSDVAIQVWGFSRNNAYLIDCFAGAVDFNETILQLKVMYNKHKPSKTLIEKKANGAAAISVLRNKLSGLHPVNPKGGKVERAKAVLPFFTAGNVHFPSVMAPEVLTCRDQIVRFPRAAKDDHVDAMSQVLINELATSAGGVLDKLKRIRELR